MVELYRVVTAPDDRFCLCFPSDLWPALSGMLSDNLWQFDAEARQDIEELLVMGFGCCDWLVDECGLLTREALEQFFALEGIERWHQLPPIPEGGGPTHWPEDGQFDTVACCNAAHAIYDAIAEAYLQIYDLANAGVNAFVGFAAPMLLVSNVAALTVLVAALVAEGVLAALELAISANRQETVCDMLSLCYTGTKEEQRQMRDYAMSQFATWSPVPLGLVKGIILPVARRVYEPAQECVCDAVVVGRPGGQCDQPYAHPSFTYQAGRRYRNEHILGECIHNFTNDNYRSAAHTGRPPTAYHENFSRGGNYSQYGTCSAVGGDGGFWQEFDVTQTTNLLRHPDNPDDYDAGTVYFRVIDLGPV